jgi:hypothetical protein
MVVIVSSDESLVGTISGAVGAAMALIAHAGDGADGPAQLRHELYCYQPKVVLLDVRFGGQRYRAIEAIPKLLLNCDSQPEIVLLIPEPSKAVRRVADEMGCFDVLDFSRKSFSRDVGDCVAAALLQRSTPLVPRARERLRSSALH